MLTVTNLLLNLPVTRLKQTLSFSIGASKLLWVKGENGAGKSTLLKTLIGLLPAASGSILWQNGVPQCFYLAHDLGIQRQMTVLDYCRWHPAIHHQPTDTACRAALASLGLLPLALRLTGQLSRGQQQRLSLACAVLSDTKLWLLDEPLTALDVQGREQVLACLRDHKARGGSAIVVSHSPIPEVADEVLDVVV